MPVPDADGNVVRRPRLRRHATPSRRSTRRRRSRTRRCSTDGRARPSRCPAWLNDPTLYHNRGDSTFAGENSQYGDFFGLDDLFTEQPDGRRRDDRHLQDVGRTSASTASGSTPSSTSTSSSGSSSRPAILELRQGAAATHDFFMFGEVFDANPAVHVARSRPTGKLQATLDFRFQGAALGFAAGQADDRAARPLRRRRLVHRRRLQRLRAADLPRQPRHGPHRHVLLDGGADRRTTCSQRDRARARR